MATTNKTKAKTTEAKKTAPAKAADPATGQAHEAPDAIHRRKVLTGTVVSDKMQKTIVVKIDRRVRHGLYKKYVMRSRRFKAHDEKNDAKMGDLVQIVETRPLSKDKRWALQSIVRRAGQVAAINV